MVKKELVDIINSAIVTALSNTHTVVVAKVTKVDTKTINCKPAINRLVNNEEIELPEFAEVPPIFLQGGGSYLAHPIAVGDYCLLLISERCFDRWYNGEDNKRPLELRMHDYSDAFAIVGVNPISTAIDIPTVIQMTGNTNQDGDYTHQGDREQTGDFTHTGNKIQTGNHTQTGAIILIGNASVTNLIASANISAASFTVGGAPGANGSFTSADGKTISVTNGIITSIV